MHEEKASTKYLTGSQARRQSEVQSDMIAELKLMYEDQIEDLKNEIQCQKRANDKLRGFFEE